MWVLEARKDAEKVSYPVVWEKTKDADNVIDYDIHGEITKDASNVINANNQTTTGMANVIPWINAPKLILTTSIYWSFATWSLQATASSTLTHSFDWYGTYTRDTKTFTITDESWTEKLKQVAQWLEIPSDWTYMLNMEYWWINEDTHCDDKILVNWNSVHTFVWSFYKYWPDNPKEAIFLTLSKWDIISMYTTATWNRSSYYNFSHLLKMIITKL